jgi:WG containing repeat
MLYPISIPLPNSADDLFGYINSHGEVIIPPSYSGCAHFFEGVAAVVDKEGKSGFIDSFGNVAISFRFQGLARFYSGVCAINGGYISHAGEWLIQPQFLVASEFSEGLAFASTDGENFGFIDRAGKFVILPEFRPCGSFREGLASVCIDERWGYVDSAGVLRIPAVFEGQRATGFSNGMAGVRMDGRWGFIDREGRFVVRPEYDDLRPFVEGRACVQSNGKWGFIDADGRQTVECRFDELSRLDRGMAPARADGKAGFVSDQGSWLIEPKFDRCYGFFGDLAVVRHGKTYSYIRRDGAIVWTSDVGAQVQHPPAPFLV